MRESDTETPAEGIEGDMGLVLALAAGTKPSKAAQRFGLSASTVYRRLRDPGFQQRVNAARHALLSEACGLLAAGATAAVSTLRALLSDKSPSIRLAAARSILEHTKLQSANEALGALDGLEGRVGTIDAGDDL